MTALEKIQNLFHDVSSGALSEMPLEVRCAVDFPVSLYRGVKNVSFSIDHLNK